MLFCYQVVGPTNELVEAKLQLKVETQRIFTQMTLKASALSGSPPPPPSFVDLFVYVAHIYFGTGVCMYEPRRADQRMGGRMNGHASCV